MIELQTAQPVSISLNLAETNFIIKVPDYDYFLESMIRKMPSREKNGARNEWYIQVSNSDYVLGFEDYVKQYPDKYNLSCTTDLHRNNAKYCEVLKKCYDAKVFTDLPEEVQKLYEGYTSNRDPFEHQKVAYCTLLYGFEQSNNFMLLDEMGLGKTKVIVDIGAKLLRDGKVPRVVIVCPATLKRVWVEEILINTDYTMDSGQIIVINGTATKRSDMEHSIVVGSLAKKTKWVIINYESSWRSEYFKAMCEGAFIAADEAHKLKNRSSKQAKGFKEISGIAYKVVLTTGTPIVNKPIDLYSLVEQVKPGALGNTEFRFNERFAYLSSNRYGTTIDGYKNINEIRDIVSAFSIRRKKEDCLTLPDKLFQKRYVELNKDQGEHYIRIVNELRTFLEDSKGQTVDVVIKAAIAQLMRLQQVCDGYLTSGQQIAQFDQGGAKFQVLDDIVEEVVENNEKQIVVWSRFVPPIKYLHARYGKFNPVMIHGGVSAQEKTDQEMSDRDMQIQKFKSGESRIFLGQIHTAGLGLTLTNCNYEVLLDRWWSPTVNNQAIDRCHRIGQKNQVTIVDLISTATPEMLKKIGPDIKTLDEIVYAINQSKQNISDEFIDNEQEKISMNEILMAVGLK